MAKRERLYVRATTAELEAWKRSARAAGARSVSAFVREVLNAQGAVESEVAPPEEDWRTALERIAAGSPAI